MEKINNKNGIIFYYEVDNDYYKIIIYDSCHKFFNDMFVNTEDADDVKHKVDFLKNISFQQLCDFFGVPIFDNLLGLINYTELELADIVKNDWFNEFKVNDDIFYTWSEE